jgi:hypothetical protein
MSPVGETGQLLRYLCENGNCCITGIRPQFIVTLDDKCCYRCGKQTSLSVPPGVRYFHWYIYVLALTNTSMPSAFAFQLSECSLSNFSALVRYIENNTAEESPYLASCGANSKSRWPVAEFMPKITQGDGMTAVALFQVDA